MSNFIESYFLEDVTICDRIVSYMEDMKESWVDGHINYDQVDLSVKDCKQYYLPPDTQLFHDYMGQLQTVVDQYIKKYPFCNTGNPWRALETINIQRYEPPGQAFHDWHCERSGTHMPGALRHLVWMTYLNDVDEGGETEWYHQKLKLQPKKGLTTIWPADWTHTHRGLPPISNTKYILTSWFNYID